MSLSSNNKLLPTLSTDHWVDDTSKKADYILAHFFESDYSQTALYVGHISSLAWVIREANGDMSKTENLLTQTLKTYMDRYFENVVVEVRVNESNQPNSYVYLNLYIGFTDDKGVQHTLYRMLELLDGKLSKVIKQNNFGV